MALSKKRKILKERVVSILNRHQDNEEISDRDDHDFLMSILQMHPDSETKIGCGVEKFVCLFQYGGSRCPGVRRTDGTLVRFSVKECLSPSSQRARVQLALRTTVHDQMLNLWEKYKRETPESLRICPVTKELRTDDNHDVDHCEGSYFFQLMDRFLEKENLDVKAIQLEKHPTRELFDRPSDPDIRLKFYLYHQEHAVLRILSKNGHCLVEAARRGKRSELTEVSKGEQPQAIQKGWCPLRNRI